MENLNLITVPIPVKTTHIYKSYSYQRLLYAPNSIKSHRFQIQSVFS